MELSTIRKGTIGELQVATDLLRKGYSVFAPLVDDFGIDLLVYQMGIVNTIQVKAHGTKQWANSICVSIKPTPATTIAVPYGSNVFYFGNDRPNRRWQFNIAINKPANNQKKKINWWEDFLEYKHPER